MQKCKATMGLHECKKRKKQHLAQKQADVKPAEYVYVLYVLVWTLITEVRQRTEGV